MGASTALKFVLLSFLLLVNARSGVFAQMPGADIDSKHDLAVPGNPTELVVSNQDGPWKTEFERICAQTEIATSLSEEQLEKLINDADALLDRLREVEDPWAKVYIFRLEKCRDFFEFALQWQAMEMQS